MRYGERTTSWAVGPHRTLVRSEQFAFPAVTPAAPAERAGAAPAAPTGEKERGKGKEGEREE